MASIADITILASRLHALTGEMYAEASRPTSELSRLAELSDDVAAFADHVAGTFAELNASLERCPVLEEARASTTAADTTSDRDSSAALGAGDTVSGNGHANGGLHEADGQRLRAIVRLLPRGFASTRASANGH